MFVRLSHSIHPPLRSQGVAIHPATPCIMVNMKKSTPGLLSSKFGVIAPGVFAIAIDERLVGPGSQGENE